jgi:hypothetical protein
MSSPQEGLLVVWLLLILTVVATFFIQRHKLTAIPPSAAAMAIGIVVGVIVTTAGIQTFASDSCSIPVAFVFVSIRLHLHLYDCTCILTIALAS